MMETGKRFTTENQKTIFTEKAGEKKEADNREEKMVRWEKIKREVEGIRDRVGEAVDENIKKTVAALLANGFKTCSSCEGHLDHGKPYPYVDAGELPAHDFLEKTASIVDINDFLKTIDENAEVSELMARNDEAGGRLEWLLDEFYKQREGMAERNLVVLTRGVRDFHISTLTDKRESMYHDLNVSIAEQEQFLEESREEMRQLTEFLEKWYFDDNSQKKEREYQRLVREMDEIRTAVHAIMKEELNERVKSNPMPTDEELKIGAFKEELEPQIRDAIGEFFRKGYSASSSGFGGSGRQQIDGFFSIDAKTKGELQKIGVQVVNGLELGFIGYGSAWNRISFRPDKADVAAMKHMWDTIAALLPDTGQDARPSGSSGSYEFRKKYGGKEGLEMQIDLLLSSEDIQKQKPDFVRRVGEDLRRGGWEFFDFLYEKSPQNVEEYSDLANEFFKVEK